MVTRAGIALAANNQLAVNTFGLAASIYNGTSSSLQINNTTATTGNVGAGNGAGINLGIAGNGTGHGHIGVAELIVMAATATAGERTSMRAYVTARYGIAM